ncbi:MAG: glycosyltransferase [Halobacteria archaeon]
MDVSAFTDSYLPNVNGAAYTVNLWKEKWNTDGYGRMTVTYPGHGNHEPDEYEYPVRSVPFPFYEGMNLGLPVPGFISGVLRVIYTDEELSRKKKRILQDSYLGYLRAVYRGKERAKKLNFGEGSVGNGSNSKDVEKEFKDIGTSSGDLSVSDEIDDGDFKGPSFRLSPRVTDADVVHVHTPYFTGLAGVKVARKKNIPLVINYHTPTNEYVEYVTEHEGLQNRMKRMNSWWEREYLSKGDAVVTPSERTAEMVVGKGIDPDKVKVIKNGVDISFFRPRNPEELMTGWGVEPPVVGYCGRHGYEKNLDLIIELAAELDLSDSREFSFVLVGDGPAREDLIESSEEAGIRDRFVFPGFLPRKDLPKFYSCLDAFVFPSEVETEGLVGLEATSCGTPVVAADAEALQETVKEGVNGMRFSPGNVEEFAETTVEVCSDADWFGERCLGMRNDLDIERTLEELDRLYENLT